MASSYTPIANGNSDLEDEASPLEVETELQEVTSPPEDDTSLLDLVEETPTQVGLSNCSILLFLAISATSLGGAFQFGFATGNVANTIPLIQERFNASDLFISVFVSGNPMGGIVGALLAGFIADHIGRKKSMVLNLIPFLVGSILMAAAPSPIVLLVGRIVVGFGVGVGSGITNIFLSEVAPLAIRGGVGMMFAMVLTVGVLVSFLLSIPEVIGDAYSIGWRLFFLVPIIPALYQTIVLMFCPEPPPYLAFNRNNVPAARLALEKYRKTPLRAEIEQLEAIEEKEDECEPMTLVTFLKKVVSDPSHRLTLIIGVGLHCTQQLSGINVVLSYAPAILSEAGVENTVIATIATGTVGFVGALVATPLVDRVGRRMIMVVGLVLMTAAYGGIALAQSCSKAWSASCGGGWTEIVAIGSVFLFLLGFAGPGSIPWLIVSEIFPVESRGIASSVCVGVNWTCIMVILLTYDTINKALQPYTFFFYMAIVLLFTIFVFLFMPETRKKSVDQITKEIKDMSNRRFPFVVSI